MPRIPKFTYVLCEQQAHVWFSSADFTQWSPFFVVRNFEQLLHIVFFINEALLYRFLFANVSFPGRGLLVY